MSIEARPDSADAEGPDGRRPVPEAPEGPDLRLLATLAPLARATPAELAELARDLRVSAVEAGGELIAEGAEGDVWYLLLSGAVEVQRSADRSAITARAGAVIGELSVLTGRPRRATVRALSETTVAIGDAEAFKRFLATTGVRQHVVDIATRRLAELAIPVQVTTRQGTPIWLRPIVPGDRETADRAVATASEETLFRRFLSGGQPSAATLDHLVFVDYRDHFAWIALDDRSGQPGEPVGVARYVVDRGPGDRPTAEIAVTIADDHQSQGIARVLLAALGVSAIERGLVGLRAETLADNTAMRALLDPVGATWKATGATVSTEVSPRPLADLTSHQVRRDLAAMTRDVLAAFRAPVISGAPPPGARAEG